MTKSEPEACPRCLRANIVREAIQPLPPGVMAPRSREDNVRCCFDCAAADTLVALRYVPSWDMARTAVANDRQAQYRLPGAPMGLVQMGLVRPSAEGDLERQWAWLDQLDSAKGG